MENVSENDRPYGQLSEVEGQDMVGNSTSLQDILRRILESNQGLQKKLDEFNHKLSENNQISETNQELKNCVSKIREEMKDENERMDPVLNDKLEKPADEVEGEVNNMIPRVQVEE
jgi:rubrerythrin